MALTLPQPLELRCRVAAARAGLSYGGWVQQALRVASEAALSMAEGRATYAAALALREAGATMRQAVAGVEAELRPPGPRVDLVRVHGLLQAGRTDTEIAADLGVTRQTAARARRRLGTLLRQPPAEPVSDQTLRALHRAGLDTAAIAAASGLTLGSCRTRLSRLHLQDNGRGRR